MPAKPEKRKILVTNALPYANGSLHLGHMVGYIQADIWVRLQKMLGHDCLYICGSDSHGTPIMIQAEKMGISPETMIEEMRRDHEKDFASFNIDFDNYYTTHSPENKELVETIYQRHLAQGNIHKRTIKQLFDPVKNMFLPDRYIKGECPNCHAKDQYGDNCEVCGSTYSPMDLKNPYSTLSGSQPIEKESEHFFFKLQNFESFLKEWTRQGHLQEQVTNKLDEWFKDGLKEWDISRDAPYFGFSIPGEKDKYFYVWLDAPVGYMASFKNLCETRKDISFDDYWGKDSKADLYHFIGKDIIYFHALFFSAMLHGAQFRTPSAIYANGFLTVDGQKMSKSRGTFIKARTYLDHLQPEYLRYYFAAKLSDRIEDLDINFDDFTLRINSDLVGKFINIASRCASFINKHFSGKLSANCSEKSLYQEFASAGDSIANSYNQLQFSHAIRQIMALADRANQYIDEKKPWALMKDPERKQEVQDVCSMGINLFRVLMIYLKPVLPETAEQVQAFLNIPELKWDDKNEMLLNHTIREFQPLINRIDPKQIEAIKMAAQQDITQSATQEIQQKARTESSKENTKDTSKENTHKNAHENTNGNTKENTHKSIDGNANDKPTAKEYISIDDFNKIDLRIATIIEAETVDGSDKLLKFKVDIGGETKQIFSGVRGSFDPASLIGKQVVIVANLAPRKMRFGVSEGMMIVASGQGSEKLFLVSPEDGAVAGMKVK